ncbi:hypothetical protein BJX64DRAFT_252135 [Aspergillus heterothallicus]
MSLAEELADDAAEAPSLLALSLPSFGLDWDAEEPSATQTVAEQIREIIAALKEIRSQLADQNKYLDVLAEKFVNPAPVVQPRVVYIDNEEWIEEIQPLQEAWHRSIVPDERRYEKIKRQFLDTLREDEYAGLEISASALADRVDRGSVTTLAAAWPVLQKPHTQTKSGVTCDLEDSWVGFGSLPSCCPRRRRDTLGEAMQPHQCQDPFTVIHEAGYSNEALLEISLQHNDGMMEGSPASFQRPWSGRVCGRIISIALDEIPWIPVRIIAFVLWQLDNFASAEPVSRAMNPGWLCMTGFASLWGKQESPRAFGMHDAEVVTLYFQMRWMRVGTNGLYSGLTPDSVSLQRDQGDIPSLQGGTPCDIKIREERHGFAMITTVDRALPLFTLVNMTGGKSTIFENTPTRYLDRNLQGIPARSYLQGNLTGLGVFLVFISATIEWVSSEWVDSLDAVDRTLHTSLAQMTRDKRHSLMTDEDFSKSDQYFAVLQTLHMCTDWINGTLQDVQELCESVDSVLETRADSISIDRDALAALCNAVIADSKRHLQPLLDRVKRKIDEVTSLRDGLLKATPANHMQAPKCSHLPDESRQQSRYILLLTVAAISYLSMCYVTPLGTNSFDPNNASAASRAPFMITFVVLSIAFYIITTGAPLVIRDDDWVNSTIAAWKLVATSLGIETEKLTGSGAFDLVKRRKSNAKSVI